MLFDPSQFESQLRGQGYRLIAGTDEAGRGPLAGPVVAAAVIFPDPCPVSGIKDSKLLTPLQREKLYDQILRDALSFGVAIVEVEEIDRINIFQASRQAMVRATEKLNPPPEILLVDGKFTLPISLSQKAVIKGDRYCLSIGAASILAKVTRDRLMVELEKQYPQFRFSVHKGYPTAAHRRELGEYGPTPVHRKSFRLAGC